jgi:trehalose 6-phosphate phosphatase
MRAPPSPAEDWAWFIDFDGTLVDIAARPGEVTVPPDLPLTLAALSRKVGGALAIVTGRPASHIPPLLAPFRPPVAGLHGWERLDPDGSCRPPPPPSPEIVELGRRFGAFAARHPGLMMEDKGIAVGLHYREAPELEESVRSFMAEAMKGIKNVTLIDGKMIFEARPRGRDKGRAVEDFMAEPPFRGRIPVYAGDDTTDEDAFASVNRLGGISILVGTRAGTKARWRLPAPKDFRAYLKAAAG